MSNDIVGYTYIFNMKKIILSLVIIIIVISLLFLLKIKNIESDHKQIKEICDKALISNNPEEQFQKAISKIKDFKTVEKVWFLSNTLYVKYKDGGQVSWSITH